MYRKLYRCQDFADGSSLSHVSLLQTDAFSAEDCNQGWPTPDCTFDPAANADSNLHDYCSQEDIVCCPSSDFFDLPRPPEKGEDVGQPGLASCTPVADALILTSGSSPFGKP